MKHTMRRNLNRGYMKLDVWQKAIQLFKLIQSLVNPKEVSFKMASQILDSSLSVPSNIAEGYCRRHLNEYIQFCYIALASHGETLTRAIGFKEAGFFTQNQFESIDEIHYEVENKLLNLVKSLEEKRDKKQWDDRIKEPDATYKPNTP